MATRRIMIVCGTCRLVYGCSEMRFGGITVTKRCNLCKKKKCDFRNVKFKAQWANFLVRKCADC